MVPVLQAYNKQVESTMSTQAANQQQHYLDNNAQILDIEPNVGVVLAEQDGSYHPYIVWEIYRKEDETNHWRCFAGEYFTDINDAAVCYLDRVAVVQRRKTQSRLAPVVQKIVCTRV